MVSQVGTLLIGLLLAQSAFSQDNTRRVTPRPPADCSKVPKSVVGGYRLVPGSLVFDAFQFRVGRNNGNWGITDKDGGGFRFVKSDKPPYKPEICLTVPNAKNDLDFHCGAKAIKIFQTTQAINKDIDINKSRITFQTTDRFASTRTVNIEPDFSDPPKIKISDGRGEKVELTANVEPAGNGNYKSSMKVQYFRHDKPNPGTLTLSSLMKPNRSGKLDDPEELPGDGGSLWSTSSCEKNIVTNSNETFNFSTNQEIQTDQFGFIRDTRPTTVPTGGANPPPATGMRN